MSRIRQRNIQKASDVQFHFLNMICGTWSLFFLNSDLTLNLLIQAVFKIADRYGCHLELKYCIACVGSCSTIRPGFWLVSDMEAHIWLAGFMQPLVVGVHSLLEIMFTWGVFNSTLKAWGWKYLCLGSSIQLCSKQVFSYEWIKHCCVCLNRSWSEISNLPWCFGI